MKKVSDRVRKEKKKYVQMTWIILLQLHDTYYNETKTCLSACWLLKLLLLIILMTIIITIKVSPTLHHTYYINIHKLLLDYF